MLLIPAQLPFYAFSASSLKLFPMVGMTTNGIGCVLKHAYKYRAPTCLVMPHALRERGNFAALFVCTDAMECYCMECGAQANDASAYV